MTPEASTSPKNRDIRPVVRRPRRGLSNTAIAIGAVVAGGVLFGVLEARRGSESAPATGYRSNDIAGPAALPALQVPPELVQQFPAYTMPLPGTVAAPVPPRAETVTATPPVGNLPSTAASVAEVAAQPVYPSGPAIPSVPSGPPRVANGPALVLDGGGQAAGAAPAEEAGQEEAGGKDRPAGSLSTVRARAGVLANRTTTVPQGTLIPAVLETAFDSTHAGFARALVQRDIRGFDGTRVLIPRGSRLIGEYGEDIAQGQRRAIILWARLIRPDGVTIAIASPSADTLGRGGVKAQVNTHFLERFSGAILQSTLDLGISLAARSARSPVLVALPGSIGGVGRTITQPADIKPTLRVPPGKSVSIFVARDLDFTGMAQ